MFILQVQFSEIDDLLNRIVGKAPANPHQTKEEERRVSSSTDGEDTFEAQEARRNTGKLLPKGVQLLSTAPLALKAHESIIRTAANYIALEGEIINKRGFFARFKDAKFFATIRQKSLFSLPNKVTNPLTSTIRRSGKLISSLLTKAYSFSKPLLKPVQSVGGWLSKLNSSAGILGKTGRFLTTGVGGRALPVLGFAIAVVDCGKDIHNLFTMKQAEGETQKEYDTRLGKARWDTTVNVGCTATGAVIGGIIGSIVPGAGTALGVMVGAGIGNLVGNLFKSDGWGMGICSALF